MPEGGALYLEAWTTEPASELSGFGLDSGRVRLPPGRLWLATTRAADGALTLSAAVHLERLQEGLMPDLPGVNWEPVPPIPDLPPTEAPLSGPGASPLPDAADPLGAGLDHSAAGGLRIPDARVVVPVSPERELSRDAPLRDVRGRLPLVSSGCPAVQVAAD